MAEWLFEAGIGEDRAILVEDGEIAEAAVELPGLRAGTVAEGRLVSILIPGRRAVVRLADGSEALLEPLVPGLTEGRTIRVEVIREAVSEPGRDKLARCRIATAPLQAGPTLRERIAASGHPLVQPPASGPDLFEQAGWSELLEQAMGGDIPFEGGALRMSVTPAMTLFDVDGSLDARDLAVAGAAAAARAIRRFGIGGSIGIDLPTLADRAERQAAAAALDALLPQPFERTAVNGFGFLQVVRRRMRPSLPELLLADRVGAAARALLRLAERTPGVGERTIRAAPLVIARLEEKAEWIGALCRRIGAAVALQPDPALPLHAGNVQAGSV